MALPPAPTLSPTGLTGLSWEGVLAWTIDHGLKVVLIVAGAMITRWVLHRLIDRGVRTLVKQKATPTTAPQGESGAAEPGDPALTGPAAPAAPSPRDTPTDQLPIVRRHARLAARALEGSFINPERQRQRVETLGSVLRSIATVVILITAALMIGDQFGLNMAPVLASAGVGGVALGFGAQSLVKDFLTGIFMLAEDQYGVGDFIDAGAASGTVEEVSLRVTKLRDPQGVIWYIRNGEITRVANKSQGWSTAIVDIPVAYEESPERVVASLRRAMAQLDEDPEFDDILLEEPQVMGLENVAGGTMTFRILGKTAPNEHWGAQREIRERAMVALAADGIRGPSVLPPFLGSYAGAPAGPAAAPGGATATHPTTPKPGADA